MAGYQRFVSYMYEYTKGKKSKNTGFAKVESRNGVCRMQVNLKEIPQGEEFLNIYGFVRKGDRLLGIFLGKGIVQGNSVNAKINTPSEQIGGASYRLEDLAGIWTQSGFGRNYITVFDDEAVDVNRFTVEQPKTETRAEEPKAEAAVSEPEPEIEEVVAEVEPEPEIALGAAAVAEMVPEVTEQEAVEPVVTESAATVPETVRVLETNESQESGEDVQSESLAVESLAAESCCQPKRDDRWMNMTRKYPRFKPFEGDEFVDCIQVLPRDLRMLHQNCGRLGNNSFVMHGYYNYRHLLFARRSDGSYILGVPGVYENQEKHMADMFGFNEFKDTGKQNRGRKFGYWCRLVEKAPQ